MQVLSLTALPALSENPGMAVMTIRDLDDEVRDKLRIRAAHNKRSMEAEVRAILTDAVASPVERSFVDLLMDLREAGRDSEFDVPSWVRHEQTHDPFA